MIKANQIALVTLLAAAGACGGTARGLEAYRADTGKLLETRSAELERCYNEALKADPKVAGTITVQFVVEKQSGAIKDAKVDRTQSTAPEVLDRCVLGALVGLTLAPPDRHEGRATFVYELKPTSPPVPAS